VRRLLREPLVHFLGLGLLLFLLYGWLHGGVLRRPEEIVVSRGQLQSLQMQFEGVWQRAPTPKELQGLVDSWVREEVLYREGLAAGLDRDDPIVRRRVGQKIEFLVDVAPPAALTDAELQAWLDAHADRYAIEPRFSLRQVYFDPAQHGRALDAAVAAALQALRSGKAVAGDSTLLPATLDDAAASDIERQFGAEFAAALKDQSVGRWQGPLKSAFGLHLVEVSASAAARPATLAEVRSAVERDLSEARIDEAKKAYFEKLRAKYTVRVEAAGPEPAAASP
jgi:hypothetical protein